MTELSPKQSAEAALERALKHKFPRTVFKVEFGDALDTVDVHWRGGPSHEAVNAVMARTSRKLGFQYTPLKATVSVPTPMSASAAAS